MCNIAGYVGTRPAAPILIEMLRREEGLNAGFYTGLATIHEGKIYYAKLTGDLDELLRRTDAAQFPGTVGLIHGRTKSGGGDAWSHPFVSNGKNGTVPLCAYVANGSAGIFASRTEEYNQRTEELLAEGYSMAKEWDSPRYQSLSDGSAVHMSDVMCQLIQRYIDHGFAPDTAMAQAFCEMPSEIVGLLLSLQAPDRIFWSRINQPMAVGFTAHGAYLASAALAFPDDSGEPILLPACSSGWVSKNSLHSEPYPQAPTTVAPMDAAVRAVAYQTICTELSSGEKSFPELSRAIRPLFAPAPCCPSALLAYDTLYALHKQGRLQITTRREPGVFEGLSAPKCYLSLRDNVNHEN